jgi:hypothetical protein
MDRHAQGILLISLSAVAHSSAAFFTRLIHLDAWTMLFWRGLLAGLMIPVRHRSPRATQYVGGDPGNWSSRPRGGHHPAILHFNASRCQRTESLYDGSDHSIVARAGLAMPYHLAVVWIGGGIKNARKCLAFDKTKRLRLY